jgi:hypothetical protein
MHIDAETVANLGAAASSAMTEMEKQLANLPPEQREAIEKMMPAMPTAPSLPTSRPIARANDVVNGVYEIVRSRSNGTPRVTCVASKTGLSDSDERTLARCSPTQKLAHPCSAEIQAPIAGSRCWAACPALARERYRSHHRGPRLFRSADRRGLPVRGLREKTRSRA